AAGKQLVQKFLLNSHAMILSFPSSWPRAQNSRQSRRATPAQTLPVDHLDRHGLQTDIVEQPRI
ncbi:hypothetical protein NKH69_27325, partial [Mesorhizobium sp. M0976]|uniref:hypothetical protein n=1 Tax=unclassified Mesorhizobium TaxID=325217 RepID=UPI00333CEC5B